MYNYKIGSRIKELRSSRGLTQQVLADRLGITKSVISAYENAMAYPTYDKLLGLADIFNVSTDYLLCRKSDRSLSTRGLTESQVELTLALISEFQKANKM